VPISWIYGTDTDQEQNKVFLCCVKGIEDIPILNLMVRKFTYRRCVDFHFFSLNFPSLFFLPLSSNEIHPATIKPRAGEESSLETSNFISESYFSYFSPPYPPR
jgi:hypothetical protein